MLELDYVSNVSATIAVGKLEVIALNLELLVFWGGGEPTRAVWFWSQTGRVMGWAAVGEA